MGINDVSFDFEIFPNIKSYHFYYKPINNDSYDISSSMVFFVPNILVDIEELTKNSINKHRATLEALAR
jgi:hypothetical protein